MFEGVTGKLGALGAKFPVVNTLMNAIRRRKNRVRVGACGLGAGFGSTGWLVGLPCSMLHAWHLLQPPRHVMPA